MRKLYLDPHKEMNLNPSQLKHLIKLLYGLAKSGQYWGGKFRKDLENDLDMKSCMSDAALFFNGIGDKLSDLCVTHVDDTLHAENVE